MVLELSGDDATVLYDLLHAHLFELRREVARTEDRTLRHTMVQRQEVCERILSSLQDAGVTLPPGMADPRIAVPTD